MTLLEEYVQAKAELKNAQANWSKAYADREKGTSNVRQAYADLLKADAEVARIQTLIEIAQGEQA